MLAVAMVLSLVQWYISVPLCYTLLFQVSIQSKSPHQPNPLKKVWERTWLHFPAMKRKATTTTTSTLSAYEIARLDNIARNTAELKRLGLHVNKLTRPADGAQRPSAATRAKRAVPPKSRWSSRLSKLMLHLLLL